MPTTEEIEKSKLLDAFKLFFKDFPQASDGFNVINDRLSQTIGCSIYDAFNHEIYDVMVNWVEEE